MFCRARVAIFFFFFFCASSLDFIQCTSVFFCRPKQVFLLQYLAVLCGIFGLYFPTSFAITGMRGAKEGVSSPRRGRVCIINSIYESRVLERPHSIPRFWDFLAKMSTSRFVSSSLWFLSLACLDPRRRRPRPCPRRLVAACEKFETQALYPPIDAPPSLSLR